MVADFKLMRLKHPNLDVSKTYTYKELVDLGLSRLHHPDEEFPDELVDKFCQIISVEGEDAGNTVYFVKREELSSHITDNPWSLQMMLEPCVRSLFSRYIYVYDKLKVEELVQHGYLPDSFLSDFVEGAMTVQVKFYPRYIVKD